MSGYFCKIPPHQKNEVDREAANSDGSKTFGRFGWARVMGGGVLSVIEKGCAMETG